MLFCIDKFILSAPASSPTSCLLLLLYNVHFFSRSLPLLHKVCLIVSMHDQQTVLIILRKVLHGALSTTSIDWSHYVCVHIFFSIFLLYYSHEVHGMHFLSSTIFKTSHNLFFSFPFGVLLNRLFLFLVCKKMLWIGFGHCNIRYAIGFNALWNRNNYRQQIVRNKLIEIHFHLHILFSIACIYYISFAIGDFFFDWRYK